jgi:hypothetical protein
VKECVTNGINRWTCLDWLESPLTYLKKEPYL